MKAITVLFVIIGLGIAQQAMAAANVDDLLSQVSMLESRLSAFESQLDAPGVVVAATPAAPGQPAPAPAAAPETPQVKSKEELASILEQVRVLVGNSRDAVPAADLEHITQAAAKVERLNRQLYHIMNPDAEVPWQIRQANMFKKPGNPLIGDHAGMRATAADRLLKIFKHTQNARKISRDEIEKNLAEHPTTKSD